MLHPRLAHSIALTLLSATTACFSDPGAGDEGSTASTKGGASTTTTTGTSKGQSMTASASTTGDATSATNDAATEASPTDTDPAGTAGTATEPSPGLSCEGYCDLVDAACSAPEVAQYSSIGPCREVCAYLELGKESDQTGNTVSCRVSYATLADEAADDQKAALCASAGPTGNGVCGGMCEAFCSLQQQICTGKNTVFGTLVECVAACAMWVANEPYSSATANADTLACRFKHLTYAAVKPDTHCSHTAADSPGVCTNP